MLMVYQFQGLPNAKGSQKRCENEKEERMRLLQYWQCWSHGVGIRFVGL